MLAAARHLEVPCLAVAPCLPAAPCQDVAEERPWPALGASEHLAVAACRAAVPCLLVAPGVPGNRPRDVLHVAERVAGLLGVAADAVARQTTENFRRMVSAPQSS